MMDDGERLNLTFDHAWNNLETTLYNKIKHLVQQRWNGQLKCGEFT